MKVTQGTNETYAVTKGTSSYLGYNVLLLPPRATLLVIDSQAWPNLKKKCCVHNGTASAVFGRKSTMQW